MKTNIFRALSEKSFRYLWIGEVLTQIAGNLFYFFLILIVFKQTQSNTAVSGAVLSFTIPAIFLGSLAGVLVDRWNKKKVLIITNVLRGLLLVFLVFHLDNLFMIYFISFIFAILTQFFIPAESPIIPLVVHKNHLLSANALFGLGIFGSILVAYVISGPVVLLLGSVNTLFFLAAMLFVGGISIAFMDLPYAKVKAKKKLQEGFFIFKDMMHTLRLISQTKEISDSLFLLSLSQILILILATIAPGYAHQVLGIHVEEFPLRFVAPAALGMVVGAIVLVNFFHSHPKMRVINFGIILSGIAMLLLPYGSKVASREFVYDLNVYLPHVFDITILHIMALLAFLLGAANSLVFVPANTIIQEKTSEEFRGKMYGFLSTLVGVLSFLPIIIVGGLSDIIGVGVVVAGIGIALLGLGIIRLFIKVY